MSERRRITDKVERDVRGIIGLMSVAGLFAVVFIQLGSGRLIAIPPEVAGVVGSVVGFYFGSKGAAGTAEQAVQGIKLDDIHALVNSRFEEALAKIESQRKTIEHTEGMSTSTEV